jgi:monoamine oxidase
MVSGGGNRHYWTETEVYRCKGGNQQLAMRLARPFDDHHLRLDTPVAGIAVRDSGVTVMLSSGEKISADDVVLAVPPSVWGKITFELPPGSVLPPTPQMGINVKFLMTLKDEFWRGTGFSPDMSSDCPIGDTWWATQGQPGPGGCLVAFSGSVGAEECRHWKPLLRPQEYVKTLGPTYETLEANFVEGRFMNWPSEPWTEASYSFPAPGQVTTCGPALQKGIMERLHFAGEHTCYAFVGYMEGAVHSGVAVAERLASRDGV